MDDLETEVRRDINERLTTELMGWHMTGHWEQTILTAERTNTFKQGNSTTCTTVRFDPATVISDALIIINTLKEKGYVCQMKQKSGDDNVWEVVFFQEPNTTTPICSPIYAYELSYAISIAALKVLDKINENPKTDSLPDTREKTRQALEEMISQVKCNCPHSDPLYWEPSGFYDRNHADKCNMMTTLPRLKALLDDLTD